MPKSPSTATPAPTVRQAIDTYLEEKKEALNPEQLQVVAAALLALLGPAMEARVDTLTPMRLLVLGGLLKTRVSPKTGQLLASSTSRRYVLIGQLFWSWSSARWPRPAAAGPSAAVSGGPIAPAAEGPGDKPRQHLGELIRLLRVDAGLTRQQLGNGTKLGEVEIKNIEMRRRLPTRQQLDRLTAVPAMQGLLAWAAREGVPVEVGRSWIRIRQASTG